MALQGLDRYLPNEIHINSHFGRVVEIAGKYDVLLRRAETSLDWMVKVLKFQHDDTGIGGGYSKLLTEASNLLDEIREVNK